VKICEFETPSFRADGFAFPFFARALNVLLRKLEFGRCLLRAEGFDFADFDWSKRLGIG
jgi:hypothetical protein